MLPTLEQTDPQGADSWRPGAGGVETPADEVATRSRTRLLYRVRWRGWRAAVLAAAALLACLALLLLVRGVATVPSLAVELRSAGGGVQARLPGRAGAGPAVQALLDNQGQAIVLDRLLLQRSARWVIDDSVRERHAQLHDRISQTLAAPVVQLQLETGERLELPVRERGVAGLGALFWLAATLALLLFVVASVVLLARPDGRNLMYATMSLAQVGNLLFLATEALPGLGLPPGFMRWEHASRSGLDLLTAAALVQGTGLYPRPLPGQRLRNWLTWGTVLALMAALLAGSLPYSWWWVQGMAIACGAVAVLQLGWMQRLQPHPQTAVLARLCTLSVAALALMSASMALLGPGLDASGSTASLSAALWVLFLASMLLMLPFLERTQPLMREFSLLAGVSTVAAALDLLFVSVFALSDFVALTLALFVALGVYASLRQWLLNQVIARERLTTERMFEQLYRMAREVQSHPQTVSDQLIGLLGEVFEPLHVRRLAQLSTRARVVGDGANLWVPVPQLTPDTEPSVIELGLAHRGKRLFRSDDARLADLVVDQLTRAVAFDQAVERGRSEERVRIAQDLHDDIGARLLTLMYQAPTREMEDYLRHTLKDLKTLTRGLAAANHRLSHAVAEWKADVAQRLAAADCELAWSFTYDVDLELSMAQWSALTRVLRELVSNAIAHAQAKQVTIDASLQAGRLCLSVTDNGRGSQPQAWSHGLGLGGVRKRVKLLGGDVSWTERPGGGIECRIELPRFGMAP